MKNPKLLGFLFLVHFYCGMVKNLTEKEMTVNPLNTNKNAVNPPISYIIMLLVQRAKLCPLY